MSDLKAKAGQPVSANKWNRVVDRLPGEMVGPGIPSAWRMVLCRLSEDVAASTISNSDTADSIYQSCEVEVYGLVANGDGTYSPVLTTEKGIMLNPAKESIPEGTEMWCMYLPSGLLVATVQACD
ncbi:hypothetical protein [Aporhodopirellula aestuarii]|uniref:Uncharacterized protein n=1 Tax=Aporhodopirellula aestuarii TaxID=2950107 RepID=A0ABT0TZ34_9BACT|nr:hypothetical protein [Aporhodopirellula aestuarii]MCM2369639.1 hypothetical protein [Aporhodopirellula aestuarii]